MRIVSLLPSGSEIVCALGLGEHLVGVSHECDYPPGVAELPRLTRSILGHGCSPAEIDAAVARASLERRPIYTVDGTLLTRLRPDLIVTQGVCAVCAVTPDTIEEGLALVRVGEACAAPVLSLGATSYAGIKQDIRAVAEATGRAGAADALIADMDRRWHSLTPAGSRPRVLMLEWPDPPWLGGHWVPEQVEAAGGDCLLVDTAANSRRTSWEEIAAQDPDILIGIACGYDLATNLAHARGLLERPEVAALRAVRSGDFWVADSNSYFSRPAPRVVDGAELLRAILSGAAVDPRRACRVGAPPSA